MKIIESLQFYKENHSIRTQAIVNVSKSFELLSNAIASKLKTAARCGSSGFDNTQAVVRKL